MKKIAVSVLAFLLALATLEAVSYDALSNHFEFAKTQYRFGSDDRYKTTDQSFVVGFDCQHYAISEKKFGWKTRLSAEFPVTGNHEITDTYKDRLAEKSRLMIHTSAYGFELSAGAVYQVKNFLFSVSPIVNAECWTLGFPTIVINLGMEAEAAGAFPISEDVSFLAGVRGEYDFLSYMIGWVEADDCNRLQSKYSKLSFIPFFGLSLVH